MARSRQAAWSILISGIITVVLTGCGAGTNADAKTPTTAHTTQSATQGGGRASASHVDLSACAGVQAIMGHLTADTARWSPALNPFDKAISAKMRLMSLDLARQGPRAHTRHLQGVIQSNARAFGALARAMAGKNPTQVNSGIEATKVSYRGLKKACSLT